MKIAVDAMGGDNAPDAIVKGALAAAEAGRDMEIILVGNGDRIKDIALLPENVSIMEAAETIENEDKPLMAIRRKRNSSMVVALQMVKDGTADAVVSAGNTGAFMAGASLIVGRIPGLTKPALAPVLPTQDGKGTVALDIGATMDPKPENLYSYALMGNLYAQTVFGIPEPRIGLLNVGIEPEKGNELAKQTYQLLLQSELNFIGNVEAREVMQGRCDVLICDGFVGNVLLKSMEGVAQSLFSEMKQAVIKGGVKSKIGALLLKKDLKALKDKLDYAEYGGSPLLGINGICIKCHGSADATNVKNAILKQAYLLSKNHTIASITKIMEE
ncbi:MAG: phosphate acyltransferase PlsX [Eubacteriales bacterium]|nr:phosphate acyltransferase PlsX [Eubacteriales bacterium]MDD3074870.1 phosphate acyltransferase PlsX [Eubacteriales bacterium]MDD4078234.1 phosphate acyltransferase PlsX [Eubacteriales bacterium]